MIRNGLGWGRRRRERVPLSRFDFRELRILLAYSFLTAMCGSHPRPIISPSVLASDFGKLAAEVQRMMDEGAEWVHMGGCEVAQLCSRLMLLGLCSAQTSWMGRLQLSSSPLGPADVHPNEQSLRAQHHYGPSRACISLQGCSQRVHGLSHDGR